MMTTAESCTGGWVAKVLTDMPGSSDWFDRGFVTYSNQAKQEMLGVSTQTLERQGAVSEETVREMAMGAIENSQAGVSLAISGIAGPGGGTEEKPVGLVYLGVADRNGVVVKRCSLSGDRDVIRTRSAYTALNMLRLKLMEM